MRLFPSRFGFVVGPAVFALCLAITACSSSNSTGSDGGTGPSPSGTFVGSCAIVTTVTAGGSTVTTTTCTDYMMQTADQIKTLCDASNIASQGITVVATYSSDHCSTTGMAGKCTLSTVVYYYDNAQAGQSDCTTRGGAWTAF